MALRALIVDDNAEFLRAAGQLLERDGISVEAVAVNGAEALGAAADADPDVILVDIDLGGESGFDVTRRIKEAGIRGRVILISTHSEDDFAELIVRSPAIGFLSKSNLSGRAIREMVEGRGSKSADGEP